MRTWTKFNSDYQSLTDTSAANETLGGTFINDSIRTICNLQGGKLRFLEATKDMTTVATQESYQIPNGFRKLIDLQTYSGSGGSSDTIYSPEMVFDPTKWKLIQQARFGSASTPYFTYVENQKYYIQPIPSVTGNLIRLRGRLRTRDLSIEDYTTGTIVSVANAGTAVVGSGTAWTEAMVGRYINIPDTTAANGGDGFWYEIGDWTDATNITLLKPYEGTSISAGAATYTIGQASPIPEAYDIAVVYRSAALYWQDKGNTTKSERFWRMYDGGMEAGLSDEYGGIIGEMLANEGETEEGSYLPPFGSTNNLPEAPYYWPFQQASGF